MTSSLTSRRKKRSDLNARAGCVKSLPRLLEKFEAEAISCGHQARHHQAEPPGHRMAVEKEDPPIPGVTK